MTLGLTDRHGRFSTTDLLGRCRLLIRTAPESGLTVYRVNANRVAVDQWKWGREILVAGWVSLYFGAVLRSHVVLKKGDCTVAGVVQDEEGETLVGATVEVRDDYGLDWALTTDDEGRYEIGGLLAVNPYSLEVTPPKGTNYMALTVGIGPKTGHKVHPLEGKTVTYDFTLKRGGAIVGRLTDDEGKPVPGVRVQATNHLATQVGDTTTTWEGAHAGVTVSDEEGRYAVRGLPQDTYYLSFHAPEDSNVASIREAVGGLNVIPPSQTRCDVSLDPGGVLRGIVRGPDGAPVPWARVFPGSWSDSWLRPSREVRCDAHGRFELTHLPSGMYSLGVEGPPDSNLLPQYAKYTQVIGGMDHSVEIALKTRCEFSGVLCGKVTDEAGNPVPGVVIRNVSSIYWRDSEYATYSQYHRPQSVTGVTDRNGEYRIGGLAASPPSKRSKGEGHYCVVESIPRETLLYLPKDPKRGSGRSWSATPGSTTPVDFTLARGMAVCGTVRDERGQPVPEASVGAWVVDENWQHKYTKRTKCDVDGAFWLLVERGFDKYRLWAGPPDGVNLGSLDLPEVNFAAGTTVEKDIVLPSAGALEGTVVDADGEPIQDAPLMLDVPYSLRGYLAAHTHRQWSDECGRFRFAGLRTGDYSVRIAGFNHYQFGSVHLMEAARVDAGEITRLEIVLDGEETSRRSE